ncbi:MAG: phage holin family protein [bacterium]|nr:phage holin family protein [bacterium]
MKYFIRVFLFNVFAIWLTSEIIPALVIRGNWQTIMTAGLVLSILMIFVQPMLKILFIPINIITFGLLSWLVNVIVLYFLTLVVPEVLISAFTFPGFSSGGFTIPAFYVTYPMALIVTSFSVTFLTNTLRAVSES